MMTDLVYQQSGFRRQSRPEPGYLAGAVTLAKLRLHLKNLFNNSRKLHIWNLKSLNVYSKVKHK